MIFVCLGNSTYRDADDFEFIIQSHCLEPCKIAFALNRNVERFSRLNVKCYYPNMS